MIAQDERMELEALVQNFLGVPPAAAAVRLLVGSEAMALLPSQSTYGRIATWVVDHSLGQPSPDRFVAMVQAVDREGALAGVHQVIARLQADPSSWTPAGTLVDLWVPPQWPFLDRDDLRTVVAQASAGDGPVVSTIEAPIGQGKRTMCAYIEMSARRAGYYVPLVRNLQAEPDPGVLDGLVGDIRLFLEIEPATTTTHEEPEREAQILARRLVQQAALSARRVWLVLNVMNPVGLEPGVLRFVDELMKGLQQDALAGDRLHLTVLAADITALDLKNLPAPQHRYVLPEVVEPAIAHWLSAAVPGKPPALYQAFSKAVLDDLRLQEAQRSIPPSRRLQRLAQACIRAHRRLAGAP